MRARACSCAAAKRAPPATSRCRRPTFRRHLRPRLASGFHATAASRRLDGRDEARRAWHIAVDGATVCVGHVLPAPAPGAPRFVATAWGTLLRDPASALCAEVLSLVFARLPLLDRLRCARVCRGWRSALRPSEHAWQTIDLGADAFPRLRGSLSLRHVVLPRYGAHVRELRLRGTNVTDADLLAVVAACPALALLDVRDCGAALHYHCVMGQGGQSGPLLNLLLRLYERAAPGDTFTLLIKGAGYGSCILCGLLCRDTGRMLTAELAMASSWLVKRGRSEGGEPAADAADSQQPRWLRCDTCPCAMHNWQPGDGEEDIGDYCEWLMNADEPTQCSSCSRAVCNGCTWLHTCKGREELELCSECFLRRNFNTRCDAPGCWHEPCVDCVARCCSVPGCTTAVCVECKDATPALFSRCDDCGAVACWRHTHSCLACHPDDTPSALRGRLGFDFRAMMKCCACARTYCSQCDPSTDVAGEAGVSVWAPDDGHPVSVDDCVYCVGFPRFCRGRATAERDYWAVKLKQAEEQAKDAEEFAARERDEAQQAAIAAQEAADRAAYLQGEAECAELDALEAQEELELVQQALRDAERDIY